MSTTLKITGPDEINFACNQRNDFDITGQGFSDEVSVVLEETELSIDHDPERKYPSTDGGTRISVYTTPHGSDCGKYPVGNLTMTVTNDTGATANGDADSTYA
jgi:hypothetical protein